MRKIMTLLLNKKYFFLPKLTFKILVSSGVSVRRLFILIFLYLLNGIIDLLTIFSIAAVLSDDQYSSITPDSTNLLIELISSPLSLASLLIFSNALRSSLNYMTSFYVMNVHENLTNIVLTKSILHGSDNANITEILRDTLNDVQNFCLNVIRKLLLSFQAILTLVFISGGLLLYPDKNLAISVFFIIFFSSLVAIYSSRAVAGISKKRQLALTQRYNQVLEILNNKDFILATNNTEKSMAKYQKSNKAYSNYLAKQLFLQSIPKPLMEGILGLLLLVAVIFGYATKFSTVFGIMIFAMYRIMPSFTTLYKALLDYIFYLPVIFSLREVTDYKKKHREPKELINDKEEFSSLGIEGVSHNYNDTEIFNDLWFTINNGDKVLISGINGSGKSTLLKILCGVIKPSKGKILFNKKNDNFYDHISYMSQKPLMVEGDIFENLEPFKKEKSFDRNEVMEYCKSFKLDHFLKSNKLVAKDGVCFASGGELQKINLLRIILERKSIILIDEMTSSVDDNFSLKLVEILMKEMSNSTIVMVSHDEKHRKFFDKVIEMTDYASR